jgi:hypothetical protein
MNNEKTSLDKLKDNIARSISGSNDAGEDIFNLYVDVVLDLISNGMTLKKATDLISSINNIHMTLMVRLYKLIPTNRSDE